MQNKMFSIRERSSKDTSDYEDQLAEASKIIEQEEAKRAELERSVS